MSVEVLLFAIAGMLVMNALMLVGNFVFLIVNIRAGRRLREAKARLPRLVRQGEIVNAQPGERIALELIVPQPPIPPIHHRDTTMH